MRKTDKGATVAVTKVTGRLVLEMIGATMEIVGRRIKFIRRTRVEITKVILKTEQVDLQGQEATQLTRAGRAKVIDLIEKMEHLRK